MQECHAIKANHINKSKTIGCIGLSVALNCCLHLKCPSLTANEQKISSLGPFSRPIAIENMLVQVPLISVFGNSTNLTQV